MYYSFNKPDNLNELLKQLPSEIKMVLWVSNVHETAYAQLNEEFSQIFSEKIATLTEVGYNEMPESSLDINRVRAFAIWEN
jgi:hypothetical protein